MNHQHMSYQPFSDKESIRFQICHPNNMGVYPLPQGSSYTCSGCQLPGSASAYVCWECKVFLHEHCFRNRSQIQPPDLSKLSICGSNCTYPNSGLSPKPPQVVPKTPPCNLIESLKHKSHPQHALKLEFYPDFWENQSSCAACGGKIKDNSAYCCASCKYNLHVKCAFLPETLPNEEHNNPLTLYYSVASAFGKENVGYRCNICSKLTRKNQWVYYCRTCDYGTETSCVLARERLKEEIHSYKESFDLYTKGPGSKDKCTRKRKWWRN